MSGLSSISAASGHFAALSGAKGVQKSGPGPSASADTTTTSTNADGSLTTTVLDANGQIVSAATTKSPNQAVIASNFATQANLDILQGQMPSSLLNMLV